MTCPLHEDEPNLAKPLVDGSDAPSELSARAKAMAGIDQSNLERCGAHTKGAGKPCNRPAGWGTNHLGVGRCKLHGGATPNQMVHAAEVVEATKARQLLSKRLAEAPEIDHPVFELIKLAAEAREWQSVLRERLDEIRDFETEDTLGVFRERALVSLYMRATEQNGKLLVDMAKLDLEARKEVVGRRQAAEMMRAARLALESMGLLDRADEFGRALALAAETLNRQMLAEQEAARYASNAKRNASAALARSNR